MRRFRSALVVGFGGAALMLLVAACDGNKDDEGSGAPVSYSQVQAVFTKNGCTACHPGVNPSLDLQPGKSYDNLVGVKALEDPDLYASSRAIPTRASSTSSWAATR